MGAEAMKHKRSIPNRSFRVADQIQRDVAELIRELKDPRIGMVTVNAVDVTPDYAHAKVFFSLLVGDPAECEVALNEAAGFIRNSLFKPLQTGLLPLCLGAATKCSQVSLDADKRYTATLKLGIRTSTGDAEGEVIATRGVDVDTRDMLAACARFIGEIDQTPPMHSALKR